ncbi:hypothetical protein TNCT_166521 [Trichonephila clavata]|uniref:Uncharacterized protein n=1 Tax=Trichonephila clavata TaxID=2740835 RepID=A0A8X6KT73_TRICU|nr:hypothetical protein TNCT_166521 [Trichonephila clavata]
MRPDYHAANLMKINYRSLEKISLKLRINVSPFQSDDMIWVGENAFDNTVEANVIFGGDGVRGFGRPVPYKALTEEEVEVEPVVTVSNTVIIFL